MLEYPGYRLIVELSAYSLYEYWIVFAYIFAWVLYTLLILPHTHGFSRTLSWCPDRSSLQVAVPWTNRVIKNVWKKDQRPKDSHSEGLMVSVTYGSEVTWAITASHYTDIPDSEPTNY